MEGLKWQREKSFDLVPRDLVGHTADTTVPTTMVSRISVCSHRTPRNLRVGSPSSSYYMPVIFNESPKFPRVGGIKPQTSVSYQLSD